MNKPLVERIERLIGLCDDPGTEQELTLMLADVRELVDAARVFDFPQDEARSDDDIFACGFGVAEMRRISAILRKVGGDIDTAPSLPAGEPQNSAVKVPDGLIEALHRQRQVDEDGSECGVSRQAVEEAISILQSLPHPTETPR